MKSFRPISSLAALALAAFLLPATPASATALANLGSAGFTIDLSATTATNFVQTQDSLAFRDGVALGETVGGLFSPNPVDWSAYSLFGISLTSEDPLALPFTVEFYDNSLGIINTYTGVASALSLTPKIIPLSLSTKGSENFAQVVGMQFTWDGPASFESVGLVEVVGLPIPNAGFFVARAPGGVRFITGSASEPYYTSLDTEEDAWIPPNLFGLNSLPPGSTSWAVLSDSNAKTEVTAVDQREVLRKLTQLPVEEWQYKHDNSRRYLGPMAQEFSEAFSLGYDNRRIATIDADGVALAALQGLIMELQERKDRSASQAKRLAALEAELEALRAKLAETLPPTE